ncbi:MAG: S9 family peptidase [Bacteroidetes bacterium]|nr:MAG: S9 family peptidase [Bacteroidota bacterium]
MSALVITSCNQDNQVEETTGISAISIDGLEAPAAKQEPKELTIHDDTRVDNYYWLNQREDQEVIDYLNAENAYTDGGMEGTKAFQEELYEEMIGRIKQTDMSVPYKYNGYYYITRYEEGNEYPIHSRKKGSLDAEEEVMLNVNDLAEGFEYYAVAGRSVSPNNKILGYGEDTLSRRKYTLRFKNLETGELLPDQIPNTTGGMTWANDNKTVFYTKKDAALRAYKIFKHKLGTPVEDDVEVYHEADETFGVGIGKTKSEKYLVMVSYHTMTQEFKILEADNPDGEFRVFEPRDIEGNLEYSIDHFGDKFYIRTNLDAKNFRLMATPEDNTGKENWTEVVAHREDVLLEGMEVFKNHLVLSERIKGIRQIFVDPWEGEGHYIDFPEEAYMAYVSTNPDFDTEVLRIGYQSMATPNSTYDYNMNSKDMELLKQEEVVGDFDPVNYKTERVFAKARDGVEVPVSIVYRKGTKIDGSAPLMLYGYGSYGYSMEPSFSAMRLSLLDRGFVYAIAHIRGGEEMGRWWYEDGKKFKKKNTFTDFIDCAEHLIAENYTSKGKVYAMGGSAGGLLMGAVVNMRPDLWNGVVAAVPFVDVVTTMLDESIPLTTGEFDEWGNPKDKDYYEYMKSYSPYDNVEAKDYPAMLVTTGLHDSQVQYWEPAKWVAKLREMKTDNNPLFLHTNMEAGHGGASGRFKRYKDRALQYAFILDLAGKNAVEVKD